MSIKLSTSTIALAAALLATPALAQTSAPVTQAPASPSSQPSTAATITAQDFVTQAANSGMFEVQSSQLAEQKSQNDDVKHFAQKMVQDHTQANEKLKTAAGSHNVPTSLDSEHSGMLKQLQQASGNSFDQNYVRMQVDGHQKAVQLFDTYARTGDDQQLKQFATNTLPTLRDHLQMITQIQGKMSSAGHTASNGSGSSGGAGFVTQPGPGTIRTSKLSGVDVYNSNNEKIGDISDVILDNQGRAKAVVIGVGGFLGVGQRDVAVPFSSIQWSMDNSNSSSMTSSPGTPGRAVLPNASRDQLKSAPEFKPS